MNRLKLLVLCFAASSCGSSSTIISSEIAQQTSRTSGHLDFTQFQPFAWEKVCFFGPYSQNEEFKKATGFGWPLSEETDISIDESINLLVFIKDRAVAAYAEYPRQEAEFLKLSGQCFNKEQSTFIKQSGSYIHAH